MILVYIDVSTSLKIRGFPNCRPDTPSCFLDMFILYTLLMEEIRQPANHTRWEGHDFSQELS